jgi:hypothetical protein
MGWEKFTMGKARPLGEQVLGTLTGTVLWIGPLLLKQGFSPELRYDLYFERSLLQVGLRATSTGYHVVNYNRTKKAIAIKSFRSHFGLTEIYDISAAEKVDDMWILQLVER